MKYYIIRESLNLKIVGKYPQSIDTKHNCHVWDEPKFIEHHELMPINFDPIISNAILNSKSKLTDLISPPGIGFTRKLLISGKLKNIIQKDSNNDSIKFFESHLLYHDSIINDYWILYATKENNDYLNFEKSEILLMEGVSDEIEKLNIKTFSDYSFMKKNIEERGYPYNIFIKNYEILDNPYNFLVLNKVSGGVHYLVSEKLKKEIEDAGCTGIEFQPSYLSLNEWLHNEREKVYGKA